jgi:hypothetical protein
MTARHGTAVAWTPCLRDSGGTQRDDGRWLVQSAAAGDQGGRDARRPRQQRGTARGPAPAHGQTRDTAEQGRGHRFRPAAARTRGTDATSDDAVLHCNDVDSDAARRVGTPARGRRATHASELTTTTHAAQLVLRTTFKAFQTPKLARFESNQLGDAQEHT